MAVAFPGSSETAVLRMMTCITITILSPNQDGHPSPATLRSLAEGGGASTLDRRWLMKEEEGVRQTRTRTLGERYTPTGVTVWIPSL